jgi:hypothetical protein
VLRNSTHKFNSIKFANTIRLLQINIIPNKKNTPDSWTIKTGDPSATDDVLPPGSPGGVSLSPSGESSPGDYSPGPVRQAGHVHRVGYNEEIRIIKLSSANDSKNYG